MVSTNKPAKRAQPNRFSHDTCDEIVERISKGETMREICREENMPVWQSVYRWMESDEDFKRRIAGAREMGFDAIAQDCLRIADTPIVGVRTMVDGRGETITREDMLGHRKLQVETRLKLLSKWDPKRYGDRIQADVTAKVITATIDATMSPEAAAEAYKSLIE